MNSHSLPVAFLVVTITSATFFTLAAFAGSSLVRGTAIKVLLTQDGQGNLQMPDKLTPSYWWKSAKEVRTLAEQMFDPRVRDTLLRSAQDYEMLAKRAEERWTYLEQQQAILNTVHLWWERISQRFRPRLNGSSSLGVRVRPTS